MSDILYGLLSLSPTQMCMCVCVKCVGGCFVLLADSSPPRVGPGRCRGVTMLINCLRSPVCVAACLPCRRVPGGDLGLWGQSEKEGRGASWKGEGGGEATEGWFAGACACVNDTTPSALRLRPCLSEQQCRRVEHESQLARAWQGSLMMFPVVRRAALWRKRGKEKESGRSFRFLLAYKRWHLAEVLPLGKLTPTNDYVLFIQKRAGASEALWRNL